MCVLGTQHVRTYVSVAEAADGYIVQCPNIWYRQNTSPAQYIYMYMYSYKVKL